jgi:hypothetical protein
MAKRKMKKVPRQDFLRTAKKQNVKKQKPIAPPMPTNIPSQPSYPSGGLGPQAPLPDVRKMFGGLGGY